MYNCIWSMKKVLIVFNHPAPYKVRLFNELSKSFDLHVIFERGSASDRNSKFYFENKYNFTTHKIKGLPLGKENILSSGVKNHIKNNKYDLIIMNGYSQLAEMKAISFMKKSDIPYLLYINGGIIKRESKLKKAIKTHFISGAKAYLSPDEQSNKYLVYYGAEENRIFNYPYSTIFENEIIKNNQEKAKIRQENGIKFEKVFVSSGQLIRRKNYLSLIEAWKQIPSEYGLYIFGDGKQKNKIIKCIKKNNLNNVVLEGFQSRENMFKFFSCADGFLFPSKEDIYGHVINESLSQGLPVISTNKVNSAVKLINDGKNGYLLSKIDGASLLTAINKLSENDHFDECVKTAKENTIEKMSIRHIEIINEVLK